MSRAKVLDRVLRKIYKELFKHATPSVDFNRLLDEAQWIELVESTGKVIVHEEGSEMSQEECIRNGWKKDIKFQDYKITRKAHDNIVDRVLAKYTKLSDFDRQTILFNLVNGCEPTIVETDEELNQKDESNTVISVSAPITD